MRKPTKPALLLAGALLTVAASVAYRVLTTPGANKQASGEQTLSPASVVRTADAPANFVGAAVCKECHDNEFKA